VGERRWWGCDYLGRRDQEGERRRWDMVVAENGIKKREACRRRWWYGRKEVAGVLDEDVDGDFFFSLFSSPLCVSTRGINVFLVIICSKFNKC